MCGGAQKMKRSGPPVDLMIMIMIVFGIVLCTPPVHERRM